MKFVFLLGGFAGFTIVAAASGWAGHEIDRVFLDAAVGCLCGALLFRWFWTVLVLNAAYDRTALRDAYVAGRDAGATHLVFTHLDEVPQWGKLWDYLFDEDIEPLFLATGPSLTGDCEEDVPGAIVRRTLPGEET